MHHCQLRVAECSAGATDGRTRLVLGFTLSREQTLHIQQTVTVIMDVVMPVNVSANDTREEAAAAMMRE